MVTVCHEPHIFSAWRKCCQPSRSHSLRAEVSSCELLRIDAMTWLRRFFVNITCGEEVTSLLAYHTSYMVYRDDLVLQQRTYFGHP